jgi:hypothetical protein
MGVLNKVAELAKKVKHSELSSGIITLKEELLAVQQNILDAREKQLELDRAKEDPVRHRRIKEVYRLDGLAYYFREPVASESDGPFCTYCMHEIDCAIPIKTIHADDLSGRYVQVCARCRRT